MSYRTRKQRVNSQGSLEDQLPASRWKRVTLLASRLKIPESTEMRSIFSYEKNVLELFLTEETLPGITKKTPHLECGDWGN